MGLGMAMLSRRAFIILAVLAGALRRAGAGENAPRVAIKGYDPVSYFDPGKPTPGSAAIFYDWDGARWQFEDPAHRALFERDPESYAPQYGGYCAMGMATGQKAEVDPELWTIINGKLYLSYDREGLEELKRDPAAHVAEADRNWAAMHQN